MNEEQEALNTVAGWGQRQTMAAIIATPFIFARCQNTSLSDQAKRDLITQDIEGALALADRIIKLSATQPVDPT